jgi:light-regulated signal transduction histidine kinase (bacteriophytochrome)
VQAHEDRHLHLVLERANEDLKKANRELEEFAYVASHDLREPLRMINIYTQLLIQRYGRAFDEQGRQFAARVHESVVRMEQLIQDVLEYSRTVHEQREDPVSPVSLNRPLELALELLRDQIEAAHGEIEIGDLPFVLADEDQLALVFQNLLSNSLKYAHPDRPPRIWIWAQPHGNRWTIYVRDNGIGFEPEFAERVFGLFKRLHGREVPGTGLGLAICRRIIERYGGEIWAEAMPDEGATFIFMLKGFRRYGSNTANSPRGGQSRRRLPDQRSPEAPLQRL